MNGKKASTLFLTQILLTIGVSLWLSIGNPQFELGILSNIFVSEGILLVPTFLFLFFCKENPRQLIPFSKIKLTSVLLVALFTMMMTPLIAAMNAFSMIFTDNEVSLISDEVLSLPFPVMIFLIGIIGPFVEEFIFRGVIYQSFKRSGRIFASIMIQALYFGLMHMNFNQFCYALVIGIALAFLVEATGSLLSSFIMHALINSSNMVLLYLTKPLYDKMNGTDMASQSLSGETLIQVCCFYFIIATFTTAIAACILYAIAKNENHIQNIKGILRRTENNMVQVCLEAPEEDSIISIPMILAILVSTGMIVFQMIVRV